MEQINECIENRIKNLFLDRFLFSYVILDKSLQLSEQNMFLLILTLYDFLFHSVSGKHFNNA